MEEQKKPEGKVAAIKRLLEAGVTDLSAIAQKTGATMNTVRTQTSRWKKSKKAQ